MSGGPWEKYRVTQPDLPTPTTAPAAPWDTYRVGAAPPPDAPYVESPSARAFSLADLVTSGLTPIAPLLLAARLAGGDTGRQVLGSRRAAFQGATLGGGDEALAAGRSIVPGQPGYSAALKEDRGDVARFSKDYPVTSTASNVGGTLGTMLMLSRAGVPAPFLGGGGTTLTGNVARGVGSGIGFGGVQGALEGQGDFTNRALNAGYGAAIGGAAGGLLPPVLALGGAIAKPLGGRWVQENVAAPVLDKLAGAAAYLTPKVQPKSLSAAAPDGGPGIARSGVMDDTAEWLRAKALSMSDTTERDAMLRVAQAMMRANRSSDDVGRRLDIMGPDATLMNAAGVNAENLLRAAFVAPGSNTQIIKDALEAQARGTPRRVLAPFEGGTPPPTLYDARRYLSGAPEGAPYGVTPAPKQGYIGTEGGRLYTPLRTGQPPVISPEMQTMLDNNPMLRRAYDNVVANADDAAKTLTPFDLLHRVKRQLNLDAEKANTTAGGRAVNKGDVTEVANEWERRLYQANPDIQAADRGYAQANALPDRLQQGYDWLRTGAGAEDRNVSTSALMDQYPLLSPNEQMVFGVGSTNAVRDITGKGANQARALARNIDDSANIQQKIETIYPDQAPAIINMARTEKAYGEAKNRITGGSDSVPKAADLADLGGVPNIAGPSSGGAGPMTRLWNFGEEKLLGLINNNEGVRDAYTRVLLETDPVIQAQYLARLDALIRAHSAGTPGRATAAAAAGSAGSEVFNPVRVGLPTRAPD